MKVIPANTATDVATTSENANYPASNLLDEHPKKQWKASSSDDVAILTITVEGKTNGLALFNIIADTVEIAIADPNDVTWEAGTQWNPGEFVEGSGDYLQDGADYLEDGTERLSDGGTTDPETVWAETTYDAITTLFGAEDFSEFKTLWVDFESFTVGIVITITLRRTDASTVLAAGALVTGDVLTSKNPVYGLEEGLEDYSIGPLVMSNGSVYYKQLDIVRTFAGLLNVTRDDDFYDFMGVARRNGMKPLAWRITDQEGYRWITYARFNNQLPAGSHTSTNISPINFDLIEVI